MEYSSQTPNHNTPYTTLYNQVTRLVSLEVDNAKLMLAEKLTVLLGRIAMAAVAFIISACVLVFVSMGVADLLLRSLPACWTYLIVAAFYFVLVVLALIFRRQIFTDPIARFLSKVILDPPAAHAHGHHSQSNFENHHES